MKTFLLIILFWPCFSSAQSGYFWLDIDYQNIWDLANDVVETDQYYFLACSSGAPASPDIAHLTRIRKADLFIDFYSPNFYLSSNFHQIEKNPSKETLIVLGTFYNGPINDIDYIDFFLLELDIETLDTIRLRTFGLPSRCESPYRMIYTNDGGIAITGWSFVSDQQSSIFLFKADSLWNQEYFNLYAQVPNRNHFGYSLIQTPDGGFFIAGSRSMDQDYFMNQALLLKVDAEGTLQFWENILPGTGEYGLIAVDVEKKEDGNYLAVGNKLLTINGVVVHYRQYWAFEFDEEGQIVWSDSYGGLPYGAQWVSVNPAPDGNYLVCGYYREDSHYENDTLFKRQYGAIGKLNPEGELLWHRLYTNEPMNKHVDIFWNAIPTSDGGILCVGTTWSDSTHQDVWAVKLDEWGCIEPGCEGPVGLVEVEVEEKLFSVYPNPTQGSLNLRVDSAFFGGTVWVYDVLGREALSQSIAGDQIQLDLSGLPDGIYLLALENAIGQVRKMEKVILYSKR